MDKLKAMAEALSASILPHLGLPTFPPISWAQNGDVVTVILADGRKVSATIQEINQIMFAKEHGQIDELLDDQLEVDLHPQDVGASGARPKINVQRKGGHKKK